MFKRMSGAPSSAELDRTLRAETGPGRTYSTHPADKLAAGTMFELDGKALLAWQRVAYLWSPGGYERAGLLKDLGRVNVLTPPSTMRVLEAGYRPWVHPSVMLP